LLDFKLRSSRLFKQTATGGLRVAAHGQTGQTGQTKQTNLSAMRHSILKGDGAKIQYNKIQ
jgi:hypothetical protein